MDFFFELVAGAVTSVSALTGNLIDNHQEFQGRYLSSRTLRNYLSLKYIPHLSGADPAPRRQKQVSAPELIDTFPANAISGCRLMAFLSVPS